MCGHRRWPGPGPRSGKGTGRTWQPPRTTAATSAAGSTGIHLGPGGPGVRLRRRRRRGRCAPPRGRHRHGARRRGLRRRHGRCLIWWRDGDGDLTDALVDAMTVLDDGGPIWLLTPKAGSSRSRVATATSRRPRRPPGLHATSTFAIAPDWSAHPAGARAAAAADAARHDAEHRRRRRRSRSATSAPDFSLHRHARHAGQAARAARRRPSSSSSSRSRSRAPAPGSCASCGTTSRPSRTPASSCSSSRATRCTRCARGPRRRARLRPAVGLLAARRGRPRLRRVRRGRGRRVRGSFLVDADGRPAVERRQPSGPGAGPRGVPAALAAL